MRRTALLSGNAVKAACAVCALVCALAAPPSSAQYYVDAEGGAVSAAHNTVRIPLDGGTRFSLTDELGSGTAPYARVRVGRRAGRSDFSLLAAPLTMRSEGLLDRPVNFDGTVFPAGARTEAVYRFDSYRFRYLREFYASGGLRMKWGGALKLRHAAITLRTPGAEAVSRNTGFVPLAAFSAEYSAAPGWLLLFDAEALASVQGRAEDVMLAFARDAGKGLRLRAGYRFLEGGSGAGTVYTFALLNYLLAGAEWRF